VSFIKSTFRGVALQAVMAWNHDGSLLASASQKGTVIRVFRLPEVSKAHTFRRGTTTSTIHSLAFSPPNVKPVLLCAASAHGTVHLFALEESVGWVSPPSCAALNSRVALRETGCRRQQCPPFLAKTCIGCVAQKDG
jgi:WD40 repeat protein